MKKLNSLFHKRIGISEYEKITFEKLADVLEKTAHVFTVYSQYKNGEIKIEVNGSERTRPLLRFLTLLV